MYYAVYQTASGEYSWCRIPANITVFAGAFRYASRMATSSDKLVAVVPLSVLQSWNNSNCLKGKEHKKCSMSSRQ
jgi:hypothetical protein